MATFATHGDAKAAIEQLQTDVASKAAASHTHAQADVTGLTTALNAKAPKASPAFTGTVTINGDNAATEDYVDNAVATGSGSLTGDVGFVVWTGSAWATARPAGAAICIFMSTNDPDATAPTDDQDGDVWDRHPDAV